MIWPFGGFDFLLLCLWRHWLRFPAETRGTFHVLPAPTLCLSWCVLAALECQSNPRVAFPLDRVYYTDSETGESIFLLLIQPEPSPPSGPAAGLTATVALHLVSCTSYRLTSALFLWRYFVGMLTSCFDNKEWVCMKWENALAHLRLLCEPIRQLPASLLELGSRRIRPVDIYRWQQLSNAGMGACSASPKRRGCFIQPSAPVLLCLVETFSAEAFVGKLASLTSHYRSENVLSAEQAVL